MKELEAGVFDLESPIPCDMSTKMMGKMLVIYGEGEGISQGIAAAILGYSSQYKKWVGLTVSKILSSLVNFDGQKMGLVPSDKEGVNQLAMETGRKMLPIIEAGLNGKPKWLKEVGRNPAAHVDKILALVFKDESTSASPSKKPLEINHPQLQCPSCKGNLPPLMKTRFCSYCGKPVSAEIQFKQAMNSVGNEASLEQMGMAESANCSGEVHASKAALAKKYVTYLERVGRAAKKKGGLTWSKLARIWQETMGTSLPYRSRSNKASRLSEQEAKALVSKNIVRFCCDCGIRLAGM